MDVGLALTSPKRVGLPCVTSHKTGACWTTRRSEPRSSRPARPPCAGLGRPRRELQRVLESNQTPSQVLARPQSAERNDGELQQRFEPMTPKQALTRIR